MDAIIINESINIANVIIFGIIAVVLLTLSAMASGSEVAFFSLTRSDIDELESRSDIAAKRVIELLSNSDRLLATMLDTTCWRNIYL